MPERAFESEPAKERYGRTYEGGARLCPPDQPQRAGSSWRLRLGLRPQPRSVPWADAATVGGSTLPTSAQGGSISFVRAKRPFTPSRRVGAGAGTGHPPANRKRCQRLRRRRNEPLGVGFGRGSPEQRHAVGTELTVVRDQRHAFHLRLREKQTVERVAVVEGQCQQHGAMRGGDGEEAAPLPCFTPWRRISG